MRTASYGLMFVFLAAGCVLVWFANRSIAAHGDVKSTKGKLPGYRKARHRNGVLHDSRFRNRNRRLRPDPSSSLISPVRSGGNGPAAVSGGDRCRSVSLPGSDGRRLAASLRAADKAAIARSHRTGPDMTPSHGASAAGSAWPRSPAVDSSTLPTGAGSPTGRSVKLALTISSPAA